MSKLSGNISVHDSNSDRHSVKCPKPRWGVGGSARQTEQYRSHISYPARVEHVARGSTGSVPQPWPYLADHQAARRWQLVVDGSTARRFMGHSTSHPGPRFFRATPAERSPGSKLVAASERQKTGLGRFSAVPLCSAHITLSDESRLAGVVVGRQHLQLGGTYRLRHTRLAEARPLPPGDPGRRTYSSGGTRAL